jgi:hypothetical protein
MHDGFVLRCCSTALTHYPACAQAHLLKAALLGEREPVQASSAMQPVTNPELENALATLVHLGYHEIPLEVYLQWMSELARDPLKYANPMITPTNRPTTP